MPPIVCADRSGAITVAGGGAEQRLSRSGQLPREAWTHLAVTLAGTTGTLYVDGVPAATNADMTLRPADLGVTGNNWIGRSQYADPFLNATVDDFQIYDRALGPAEVQRLASGVQGAGNVASYRFDEAAGADVLDSSGNGRTATIVSPPVNVLTPQGLIGYWEAPYLFKRGGTYYLAYARGNPRTGGNPATIDYATAAAPLGPWTYRGRILDTVSNTTTNHSAIVQFKIQWVIVYHNGMLPRGGEFRRSVCIDRLRFDDDGTIQPVVQTLSSTARQPVARYTFDRLDGSTFVDQTGNGWDATAFGGATTAAGVDGAALSLNGDGQYVGLPTGIGLSMYDFTVAAWVRVDGPGTLAHVFDFGTGPTRNMYLTPAGPTGAVQFAITTNGPNGARRIDGTEALPVGEWVHVTLTKSALTGTLYVNGAMVGQNQNLDRYPAQIGNAANNWIGRSQRRPTPSSAAWSTTSASTSAGSPPTRLPPSPPSPADRRHGAGGTRLQRSLNEMLS
jgi:hypothetical protein